VLIRAHDKYWPSKVCINYVKELLGIRMNMHLMEDLPWYLQIAFLCERTPYLIQFLVNPVTHSFSRCERTNLRGLVLVEDSFDSDKKGYFCTTREFILLSAAWILKNGYAIFFGMPAVLTKSRIAFLYLLVCAELRRAPTRRIANPKIILPQHTVASPENAS
jgi:hypothetical protein